MAIRFPVQVVKVNQGEYRAKDGTMKSAWSISMVDDDGEVYRLRMFDQVKVPTKGKFFVNLEASADFQYVRPVSFEPIKA